MKLFLDTSVLLAAAGSSKGASHALFDYAEAQRWELIASRYVLGETERNIAKLPTRGTTEWIRLRPRLTVVDDILTLDRPVVFAAGKDRPVLFTALAWTDVLLTLDKEDFAGLLGTSFYGLPVLLPYDFLERERGAGRLLPGPA